MGRTRASVLRIGLAIVAVATAWQAVGTAAIGTLSTPEVSGLLSFIAFAAAALFCAGQALLLERGSAIRVLLQRPGSVRFVLLQNVMTAGVFVCFYFSLAYVPATAASVIEAGIGPLVAALATIPLRARNAGRRFLFPLITALLAAVIVAQSLAVSAHEPRTHGLGVLLAVCAGLCGVGVVLCSMKLVERDFTATDINALRFHGAWIVSGATVLLNGLPSVDNNTTLTLVLVAVALGAAPLIALQYGITRSTPLATEIVMSTLPALVFLSESVLAGHFAVSIALWMVALLACAMTAVLIEQRYADPHPNQVRQADPAAELSS